MPKLFRLNPIRSILAIGIGLVASQIAASAAPCDIYSSAATPCVAAYSMARQLLSTYTGPLYQVRKADGTTKDIPAIGGFVNAAVQDTFCGTGNCNVAILYDQSGKGNDLIKAPAGCYTGTASQPDNEANVKGHSIMVGGHKAYGLYMVAQDGYRNNKAAGMPTGSQAQGIYEVADGKRGGPACCWDFGNASTNNCNGGVGNMAALFLGVAYWGKGAGNGPWFLADLEAGVWAGGAKVGDPGWGALSDQHPANPNNLSMAIDFAFGILKTSSTNYAIRIGNAQSGNLTTAYDGALPSVLHWSLHGGIVLGIGGDNSNSSNGTFFEGAITSGRPSDTADASVFKNVQDAGFGSTTLALWKSNNSDAPMASVSKVQYNASQAQATVRYNLHEPHRVALSVFDTQGKLVATLAKGLISQGDHEAVWNAKRAQPGLYIVSLAIDGNRVWTANIVVKK